jgi:hypothetical protein
VSAAPIDLEAARAELAARCDTIEECYEFMLAYAAQGLQTEGGQIRDFLLRCDAALKGLSEFAGAFIGQPTSSTRSTYAPFMAVLDRDARDSEAAVQLVLAQTTIGSQIIDNLNASIHLRALLTDLFLFDEVLKAHRLQ